MRPESAPRKRSEAWEKCQELAGYPHILDEFASELSSVGVVGERRAAQLIYLAVTSRMLDRPVSVAVKGPSSGGKSFVVELTLKFFPPEAFYALTAMSDRALAYSSEPLKHRHLVHLRGGRNGLGFCDLSDPVAAVRRPSSATKRSRRLRRGWFLA